MNQGIPETHLKSLSGQVAGVNVSTDGSERMAMLNSVRVRGTTSITGGNDPLVIIDGISSDLATLSTIFPADIAPLLFSRMLPRLLSTVHEVLPESSLSIPREVTHRSLASHTTDTSAWSPSTRACRCSVRRNTCRRLVHLA